MAEWTGRTHLTRDDGDGIVWRIKPGPRGFTDRPVDGVVLTMVAKLPWPGYADISATTDHVDEDAAKAFVEELLASWTARTMREFEQARLEIARHAIAQAGMF